MNGVTSVSTDDCYIIIAIYLVFPATIIITRLLALQGISNVMLLLLFLLRKKNQSEKDPEKKLKVIRKIR
jgi:hypothetical protein